MKSLTLRDFFNNSRTLEDAVQKYYITVLDNDQELIDLMFVYHILYLCVTGLCVDDICRTTGQCKEYIQDVLNKFLFFNGWEYTLDINPIVWYNLYRDDYRTQIKKITDRDIASKTYLLLKVFNIYTKTLDEHWK